MVHQNGKGNNRLWIDIPVESKPDDKHVKTLQKQEEIQRLYQYVGCQQCRSYERNVSARRIIQPASEYAECQLCDMYD